ncbi:MAG: prepilin-type N-terminal cleavage/methylation domain-containing protein, partial [Bacilli bacterium]|nr:prepilin-type N-terminal cleavage/methylation domain-containing protein [Bacilli bacterium]
MKMHKKLNKKGFTMVELLGVIVILGILSVISIVAIQGVMEKAKKEYYKTQKNNMIMSTESYLNSNKNLLPKVSGQIIKVNLETLEKNKFIDKVVDYNKNDCDSTNSYVQVFKYRDEINYTSYLKCPSYDDNNNLKQATPIIRADFVTDLSNASVTITVSGGKNGADNIGLASYQYKIYKNGKLEYTSDIIDGDKTLGNKTSKVSLVKYVPGAIKIVVNAININGYSSTKSFSPDGFIDNTPPYCNKIVGQSTSWTTGKRTITVNCIDDESGCKKDSYTQEFTEEAITAIINLENNSGKTGECQVNVYIDKYAPKVTLKAYKRKADGTKDSSQLVGTITTDDTAYSIKNFKINQNVVNGWLNNANYPYGVYFEASYSDKNNIDSLSWSWNNGGLLSTDSNVKTLTGNDTKSPNKTSGNYSFSLSGEGYRYGELKIKDISGHYSLIKITVPIDRTAPNTPSVGLYKWSNNSTTPSKPDGLFGYTENTWSDLKVFTIPSSSDSLSGLDKYRYTTTGATGNNSDKQANYYNVTSEGTSTIKYKACDKAGNCSNYTGNKNIKIDISGP